jgi:hypothetical protein
VELLVGIGILIALAIPFAIALRRSNELFRARVRSGRLELSRGRIPQALFDDLEDVFAGSLADAELRVVVEGGRARAELKGIEGTLAQRVRNVVGRFRVAEIRAGRRAPNRAARRRARTG